MSSKDVVIRAEGLGKKYTIQHAKSESYSTIRDSISNQAAALGRWANPFTLAGQIRRARRQAAHEHQRGEEDFWALKDVSFEIRRGERVGIIGRNGAGKSTLLKILSRITEPTTGRVEIRGRVASLLEVGTGFHPELTGRENIYLNGAILGMKRREIRSKFDEIVDFSEVEKFLDTPVKRYSSGMYVRLAFAVAAHLEPEILVLDEVLAVGDASFQKKCLGKMEDVADREERSILFVSHHLSSIQKLCNRGIVMSSGRVLFDGLTEKAVECYTCLAIQSESSIGIFRGHQDTQRSGSREACFEDAFFIEATTREKATNLTSGNSYIFVMKIANKTDTTLRDIVVSYAIADTQDSYVLLFRSTFEGVTFHMPPGITVVESRLDNLPLAPSRYSVILFCSHRDTQVLDSLRNSLSINVENCNFFESGTSGLPSHCKVLVRTEWSSFESDQN